MAFPGSSQLGNAYYLYVNGTLADSVTVIKADSIKADYSHNVMLEGDRISMIGISGKTR